MTAIPNSLALVPIVTNQQVLSADHRTNYASIQVAMNALIALLSGGTVGQVFTAIDGSNVGWSSGTGAVTAGTVFPVGPTDGQEFVYIADAGNGVFWRFRWYAAGSYWAFVGGPPLYAEVLSQSGTASSAYGALGSPGPAIAIPFAGDFDVRIGCQSFCVNGANVAYMSYDIGGTGAVDDDAAEQTTGAGQVGNDGVNVSKLRRKTGLGAVTLTAKYKNLDNATNVFFQRRWMAVTPVKK